MPFRELVIKELYDANHTSCPYCGEPWKEKVGRRWCDNVDAHQPSLPVVEDRRHRVWDPEPDA